MKNVVHFMFKRHLMFVLFLLFGSIHLYAADDDLITEQIVIKMDDVGTLPYRIGSNKKYKITNLKIIGSINGTDVRMIRNMAGNDYQGNLTEGNLTTLDLSYARIKEGGEYYYAYYGNGYEEIRTVDNHINDLTFIECLKLTNITLPTNTTEIGNYAFIKCSHLKNINIPASVTKIGKYAFKSCTDLTSVNLPTGLFGIMEGTFKGCTSLTSVNIPNGVKSIGYDAFNGCADLTSVNIPNSVESIGSSAFSGCTGLTSVNIQNGVKSIGNNAFNGCAGLTSVNIPNSVESIGSSAFSGCTGLTSVNFNNIGSIGSNAFSGCTSLTNIHVFRKVPAKLSENTFEGVDKESCILYVPKGTYQSYWLAEGWGDFKNIVEFDPTGIDYINTQTEPIEVSRYTLDGKKAKATTKGVAVVTYSDGTKKKVIAK